MPITIIGLILLSVVLSALAQIVLKIGMSSAPVSAALSDGSAWKIGLTIITTPYVLMGLACYGLSMVVWLFVLAEVDVSLAYPFVSVGFLITLALGVLLLGEHLSALRILGTLLVALGVVLVSQS
jgi:drug/metabolite transporter (DMT)-like permease